MSPKDPISEWKKTCSINHANREIDVQAYRLKQGWKYHDVSPHWQSGDKATTPPKPPAKAALSLLSPDTHLKYSTRPGSLRHKSAPLAPFKPYSNTRKTTLSAEMLIKYVQTRVNPNCIIN